MNWQIKLEGGPFDGDQGRLQAPEQPERLWAFACSGCGGTHWTEIGADGRANRGEEYVYDREEEGDHGPFTVYVHVNCDLSSLPTTNTSELMPA